MESQVERAALRAVEVMRQNFSEQICVDDLARAAIFSKFHFSRVFHRVTGLSPGQFLAAIRIEEAKRLLVSTSWAVTDISHRVGYSSVGSFSSRFTASVGIPPTIYRQFGGVVAELPTASRRTNTAGRPKTVRGTIWSAKGDRPVFLGLFAERILGGRPVRYTVLQRPGQFELADVPLGAWHLMARSADGDDGSHHIGAHGPIVVRPDTTTSSVDVRLRTAGPLDPPVLLALPDLRPTPASAAAY